MEAIGVVGIFERSVPELKLRYTTYIGDGDSKAYPTVVAANPYPGKDTYKNEWVVDFVNFRKPTVVIFRKCCNMKKEKRINKMERKMSVEGKSDRKRKRAIKKGFQVRNDDVEGKMDGSRNIRDTLPKSIYSFICIYSHMFC